MKTWRSVIIAFAILAMLSIISIFLQTGGTPAPQQGTTLSPLRPTTVRPREATVLVTFTPSTPIVLLTRTVDSPSTRQAAATADHPDVDTAPEMQP